MRLHEAKKFLNGKGYTIIQAKQQPKERVKIFASYMFDRILISHYIKN